MRLNLLEQLLIQKDQHINCNTKAGIHYQTLEKTLSYPLDSRTPPCVNNLSLRGNWSYYFLVIKYAVRECVKKGKGGGHISKGNIHIFLVTHRSILMKAITQKHNLLSLQLRYLANTNTTISFQNSYDLYFFS